MVLVACGCVTDLQSVPESDASLQPAGCFRTSRLANRGQNPRAIKCLPASSVVKRKDERRESIAATNNFRRAFRLSNFCSSVAEGFALSIVRPERLIELSGTPPPAVCC
jgi:hypothetical protein